MSLSHISSPPATGGDRRQHGILEFLCMIWSQHRSLILSCQMFALSVFIVQSVCLSVCLSARLATYVSVNVVIVLLAVSSFAYYLLLLPYLLSSVSCLSFGVCCLLSPLLCIMRVVCCLLSAVCCRLSSVSCLSFGVCCLLSAVCCLLSACCLVYVAAHRANMTVAMICDNGRSNVWHSPPPNT
jgi:hypothetical protein